MTEQDTALAVRTEPSATVAAREIPDDRLSALQPSNMRQLLWFAGEVAKTGDYLVSTRDGGRAANTFEVFRVMQAGLEFGISPLQALDDIYCMVDAKGRKSYVPKADLLAARVLADPRTEEFDVDDDTEGIIVISARRRGRKPMCKTFTFADFESRLRAWDANPMLDRQERLRNASVRWVCKKLFPDMIRGLVPPMFDDLPAPVVEATASAPLEDCPSCRAQSSVRTYPNPRGGAYRECSACGLRFSPSDAVRDAIRGAVPIASVPDDEEIPA